MEILTSELADRALDWAVATAQGFTPTVRINEEGKVRISYNNPVTGTPIPRFSTDWSQGGLIIDRERIQWVELAGGLTAWCGWDFPTWLRDREGDLN